MTDVKKTGIVEAIIRRRLPHLNDAEIETLMSKPQGEIIRENGPLVRKVQEIVSSSDLDDLRRETAEEIFAVAENPGVIKNESGYRYEGDTLTKIVFMDNGDEPSSQVEFGVKFEPGTADVAEIYGAFDPSAWWAQRDNNSPAP